jgi:putative ABC transport system permease protein
LFVLTFTFFQLDSWVGSIFFTIGIGIAFLILAFVAWLLMKVMRLVIKSSWSYLLRQGFANLYRPNNQTIILIVSIGLSTAFICTLFFIQGMLMKQVSLSSGANQANMILFDIQSSQAKSVAELTRQQNLPILQQVPIVTIRLDQVNGKTAADIKKDTTSKVSRRAFAYEYRVTYRDTLTPSEKIVKGEWTGKAVAGKDVPVSIEEGFSKRNHINLGDHLVFNVQGLNMPVVVGSVRQVNWNKIQTNFQVVFPKGVLEDAPQYYVELTHVPTVKASAKFQQAMVRSFPNVSVIDIGQVIAVVDDLLDKIGYIIKFMSAFSIITGVVVLIASVRISKYQRIQESVLLRTLGASRKQIFAITALEYLFLGALSALTGILIAFTGSWLLAKYSFEIPFAINFLPVLALFVIIALLTLVIGLLNSRGVLSKPPLEILRTT